MITKSDAISQTQGEKRKHHKIICRKVVGDVAGLMFDLLEENNTNRQLVKSKA
jgi:hypothetical protein